MSSRLRELSVATRELEARLREGGGPDKASRQHKQGKLTARERVTQLMDADSHFLEQTLTRIPNKYAPVRLQVTIAHQLAAAPVPLPSAAGTKS